jgi:exonuclease SbcD
LGRFAHLGDCHIGAWRDRRLREINLETFLKALDVCAKEQVDFVIISGDIFDTTLPDLSIAKRAVEKIKENKDAGIQFYVTYGSHDFSPNSVSLIDILTSTGLLRKVVNAEVIDEKLNLSFVVDQKTGAKICGLSGRKLGLEKKYYKMLVLENLESERGFKIFVFHNALIELRPTSAAYPDGVPISNFPRGFNYYAGGHVHERLEHRIDGYGLVAFPGCLFGATFSDLEETAKGQKRGFFIIDFEEEINNSKFVEIKTNEVIYNEVDATKKTARQIEEKLNRIAKETEVEDKIVLLKAKGILSSGKPSDINFSEIRRTLLKRKAVFATTNRYGLSSEETFNIKISGESIQDIEEKLLTDAINTFKIDPTLKSELKSRLEKKLSSAAGLTLAKNLLNSLKLDKQEGENQKTFESRILKNALHLLSLEAEN